LSITVLAIKEEGFIAVQQQGFVDSYV
jgi:hypothetical protein